MIYLQLSPNLSSIMTEGEGDEGKSEIPKFEYLQNEKELFR